MSVLAALLEREVSGLGQFIDVSMHACSNTTTEMASYGYLATGDEVMRLTGRHAAPRPSQPTQALCADGNWLNTGVPPRNPKEFGQMIDWLDSLGLRDEFALSALLEMGAQRERITMADVVHDPLVGEIFGAGREAMWWIASKVSAYDFFIGAQSRGLACGVIYAPEDVFQDPHFVERGFPVSVEHPELGRSYTYPGAPYVFRGTPWEIRHRAPSLGEHQPILAEWASQAT
jgi:crotonobetainyl-CoA:carnitine CoA-transferase CaiB-like acyl-CoA transferase